MVAVDFEKFYWPEEAHPKMILIKKKQNTQQHARLWALSKLNFAQTMFIELFEFCAARADLKGTWMHFPAVNQTGLETKET